MTSFRDDLRAAIAAEHLTSVAITDEIVDALAPFLDALDAANDVRRVADEMGDDFGADTIAVHVLRERLDALREIGGGR